MLQLQHARKHPSLRTPNTLAALRADDETGLMGGEDTPSSNCLHRLLRTIEGRLRLMNSTARDAMELNKAGPPAPPSQQRCLDGRLRKNYVANPRAVRRGVRCGREIVAYRQGPRT